MSGDLYLNKTPTTAGIKSIFWFIPIKDVESQNGAIVTLKAGKQWNTFKGIKFKGNAFEKQRGHRLFTVGIKAAIAHLSPELDDVIKKYIGAEGFLIIYEDLNNYRWIIGSLRQPLRLAYKYESGDSPGGNVGINIGFSGNVSGINKLEYKSTIDAEIPVPPLGSAGAFIKNSDNTYNALVPAGSIFVLPDINIIKNDNSVVTSPSVKDLDLRIIDPEISTEAQLMLNVYADKGLPLVGDEKTHLITYVDSEVLIGHRDISLYEAVLPLAAANSLVDNISGKIITLFNSPQKSNDGYIFDGATQYANTSFNPKTESASLNDFAMAIFIKQRNSGTNDMAISAQDGSGNRSHIQFQSTGAYNLGNNNSFNSVSGTTTNSNVLIALIRISNTEYKLYENGIYMFTISATSSDLPDANFNIGAREIAGAIANYFDGTISYICLTSATGYNPLGHYNNVKTLLTNLGLII